MNRRAFMNLIGLGAVGTSVGGKPKPEACMGIIERFTMYKSDIKALRNGRRYRRYQPLTMADAVVNILERGRKRIDEEVPGQAEPACKP